MSWTGKTGEKQANGIMYLATRPSNLYPTLCETLGDKALVFRDLLFAVAIFFESSSRPPYTSASVCRGA